MINLKTKFIKELEKEIENALDSIEYMQKQIKTTLPERISAQRTNIENLKGLLDSVQQDQHFTDPVFSY